MERGFGSADAGEPAPEVTVVLPCLNESRTVAACVAKALAAAASANIAAEVVVADNGSTDGSQELARAAGARVVEVPVRGYGAALRAGIEAARGRFVVMADSDDSYELGHLPDFVAQLRAGSQLVMGSRFRGKIHPGAMPLLHRYLGNPVLTFILNLFFGAGVSDAHCGLRAFSRDAIRGLDLRSSGMEFASEMIIRAAQEKLHISEVPTDLRPDGRGRPPHLRTWRDGWRHLRFMLLFSPLWLFVVPGVLLTVFGFALTALVAFANVVILGHRLNTHFALLGSTFAIVGLQLSMLGVFSKTLFVLNGIGTSKGARRLLDKFHLESALVLGLLVALGGAAIDGSILFSWLASHGAGLSEEITHRAIFGGTLIATGVEIGFNSFFLSILKASRTGSWV